MRITYTHHAREKFQVLARHGFSVREDQVEATVLNPETLAEQPGGRFLAQRVVTDRHVLRVIYRVENDAAIVITFYPGYRGRYESNL